MVVKVILLFWIGCMLLLIPFCAVGFMCSKFPDAPERRTNGMSERDRSDLMDHVGDWDADDFKDAGW